MADQSLDALPAQQVPPAVQLVCPKHGDITSATLNLTFADNTGEKKQQFLYCLHCLNEVLLSLQKAGTLETVQVHSPELAAAQEAAPKVPTAAEAIAALAGKTSADGPKA